MRTIQHSWQHRPVVAGNLRVFRIRSARFLVCRNANEAFPADISFPLTAIDGFWFEPEIESSARSTHAGAQIDSLNS